MSHTCGCARRVGWPAEIHDNDTGHAAALLTDLINCGGLPDSDTAYVIDEGSDYASVHEALLGCLERAGYVCCERIPLDESFGVDVQGWRITPFGLEDVSAFQILRAPEPALLP
eukprot:9470035-Pyramimonas_sp.AAC.1